METSALVQEVKDRLQWSDDRIEFLNENAPDHLEYAKEYTNNSFTDRDGVELIPKTVLSFVSGACEYQYNVENGYESESMGDVTWNYETDYPPSLMRKLKRHKRVSF